VILARTTASIENPLQLASTLRFWPEAEPVNASS
jgi:hypothetical protein